MIGFAAAEKKIFSHYPIGRTAGWISGYPELKFLAEFVDRVFEICIRLHHVFNGFKRVDHSAVIAATEIFADKGQRQLFSVAPFSTT